jgi:hypothetical protein
MKVVRQPQQPVATSTASQPLTDAKPSHRPTGVNCWPADGFDGAPSKGTKGTGAGTGTTPTPAANSFDLTFHGGKVLKAPVFQPIYVGDYWKTTTGAADRTYNDAFAKDLVSGGHEALLGQYGVGTGSTAPSTVVAGKPKTMTQAQVEALVKKQVAAGAVADGPETVHMVVLPPGTVLKHGTSSSKNGLGGFHGSFVDDAGKTVYYGVVVYSQGKNGIDFTGKGRDNVTITESHEFDEAATDPDVGHGTLGWYNAQYGEIGDLAVNSGLVPLSQSFVKDEKGFSVQVEWSNADHAFKGVK